MKSLLTVRYITHSVWLSFFVSSSLLRITTNHIARMSATTNISIIGYFDILANFITRSVATLEICILFTSLRCTSINYVITIIVARADFMCWASSVSFWIIAIAWSFILDIRNR